MTSQQMCSVCHSKLEKKSDWNLLEGKHNYLAEIKDLPFQWTLPSRHVCRHCLAHLQQRRTWMEKIRQVENLLWQLVKPKCSGLSENLHHPSKTKRERDDDDESIHDQRNVIHPLMTSTPTKPPKKVVIVADEEASTGKETIKNKKAVSRLAFQPPPQSQSCQLQQRPSSVSDSQKQRSVTIKVEWANSSRNRTLPGDLVPVGLMLCRGTYKQIAKACWQVPLIHSQLVDLVVKEVNKECERMSMKGSEKRPQQQSILRKTSKEDVVNFSFENFEQELQTRAPLFHGILKSAASHKRKKDKNIKFLMQSTCMAAAICLKNRCPSMTVIQLIISIILQHSGIMVGVKFFINICLDWFWIL